MYLKIPDEWYAIRRELRKKALKSAKEAKTGRAIVDYMIIGAESKIRPELFESTYKFRIRYAMFLGWIMGKEESNGK